MYERVNSKVNPPFGVGDCVIVRTGEPYETQMCDYSCNSQPGKLYRIIDIAYDTTYDRWVAKFQGCNYTPTDCLILAEPVTQI